MYVAGLDARREDVRNRERKNKNAVRKVVCACARYFVWSEVAEKEGMDGWVGTYPTAD